MDATNDRKIRHLRIIEADREADRRKFYFDSLRLVHRALPELNLRDVDPSIEFMGKKLSFPLLISSMTGGDHAVIKKINHNLAVAAETMRVAMGVGSQRVMFSHPEARASFDLRKQAPTALLFANLGAVQLNYGFGASHCRDAIAALDADALYLHLNPLQEAVQPKGNTNFAGLADKIAAVARELDRPIILKEVGAGFSARDVETILNSGIRFLDVAGSGGTSWSRIEHHNLSESEGGHLGLVFQDWGIPTPQALIDLKPYRDRLTLIASGGIRSGIDMAKAMILGASLCGAAAPFLQPAMESADKVIEAMRQMQREFVTAMFLMGIANTGNLMGNEALLLEPL